MEPVGPWRKSSHSTNPSGCVEVAIRPDTVTVRDSKNPSEAWLRVSRPGFAALIAAVRVGELHPPPHERNIMADETWQHPLDEHCFFCVSDEVLSQALSLSAAGHPWDGPTIHMQIPESACPHASKATPPHERTT